MSYGGEKLRVLGSSAAGTQEAKERLVVHAMCAKFSIHDMAASFAELTAPAFNS